MKDKIDQLDHLIGGFLAPNVGFMSGDAMLAKACNIALELADWCREVGEGADTSEAVAAMKRYDDASAKYLEDTREPYSSRITYSGQAGRS